MTTISVRKTIPETSVLFTTGWSGGDTTINILGVENFIIHSKKDLIKVRKQRSKSRQRSENSDKFYNSIVDLKKGTDEIVFKGYLEDDSTSSAWLKFWQLRAMCSRGGPLTSLTIGNITFLSSTQEAFLEDITGTAKSDDTGDIQTINSDGTARIEVSLQFFIGDER